MEIKTSDKTDGPKDGLKIDKNSTFIGIGMKCEGRYEKNATNNQPDFIAVVNNFIRPSNDIITGIKLKIIEAKDPASHGETVAVTCDKSGEKWNNFSPHSTINDSIILRVATN